MDAKPHKPSNPVPLHRVAVVRPFTQFLADVGAPVEKNFRQVALPYSALENINNYVPSHRFWAFLVKAAYSEGIQDLGFRVGEQFGADGPDPHITDLLQKSPTVFSGLMKASEVSNRTISHCQVGILQPPNCKYAYLYHKPSCSGDNPAIEQIGWFGLMTLRGMVRACVGPHWQPAEIGVMTHHSPCQYIHERLPHTRLRFSQPYSYVTLEKALLCLPPLRAEGVTPACSPAHFDPLPDDFVDSLEQILLSYIHEKGLNLELAAGLCNLSKRTLQRKLKAMGTHYAEVLDHARFRAASQLLRNPGMTVTRIARKLGYSDVAHFARAFRRIAGVTPLGYRQQFLN